MFATDNVLCPTQSVQTQCNMKSADVAAQLAFVHCLVHADSVIQILATFNGNIESSLVVDVC